MLYAGSFRTDWVLWRANAHRHMGLHLREHWRHRKSPESHQCQTGNWSWMPLRMYRPFGLLQASADDSRRCPELPGPLLLAPSGNSNRFPFISSIWLIWFDKIELHIICNYWISFHLIWFNVCILLKKIVSFLWNFLLGWRWRTYSSGVEFCAFAVQYPILTHTWWSVRLLKFVNWDPRRQWRRSYP